VIKKSGFQNKEIDCRGAKDDNVADPFFHIQYHPVQKGMSPKKRKPQAVAGK